MSSLSGPCSCPTKCIKGKQKRAEGSELIQASDSVWAGNYNFRIPFSSDILAFYVPQPQGLLDLGLLFLIDKPLWALIPPEPAGFFRLPRLPRLSAIQLPQRSGPRPRPKGDVNIACGQTQTTSLLSCQTCPSPFALKEYLESYSSHVLVLCPGGELLLISSFPLPAKAGNFRVPSFLTPPHHRVRQWL